MILGRGRTRSCDHLRSRPNAARDCLVAAENGSGLGARTKCQARIVPSRRARLLASARIRGSNSAITAGALAAYFPALPWPAYREPADAASITRFQALDVEKKCTSCHREGFVGYANTPRVANQKLDYLIKTLSDFHDNKRSNSRAMAVLVRNWSADDIAAMAHYLAGL